MPTTRRKNRRSPPPGRSHVRRLAPTTPALIEQLESLRQQFGAGPRTKKLVALRALSGRDIDRPALLQRLHDALSWIQAYPDDPSVLAEADRALAAFAARVARLPRHHRDDLADTGIAGTELTHSWSYDIARELVRAFPRHVFIARDDFEEPVRLDDLVRQLISWAENDAIDDTTAGQWDWLDAATAAHPGTDAHWLIERLARAPLDETVRQRLYDTLDMPLTWRLDEQSTSRTFARLDGPRRGWQRNPLRTRSANLARAITRPMPPLRLLSEAEGARVVRAARLASCLRHREVYAFTHGNPAEVWACDPDPALRITFVGVQPLDRFPIESTYGTLLLRNGVPIGYGYHTLFLDRAETGINVYDTWRGGEAAWIFERMMAALHRHFGTRRFFVHRYQIGDDNDEALESGSFWFYYKMGFRPIEPHVAELAASEREKVRRRPGYRCDTRTLRRLAQSDMYFGLPGAGLDTWHEPRVGRIGLRVTEMITRDFAGDRVAAEKTCAARLARAITGGKDCSPRLARTVCRWKLWPADQRMWFERLSVVLALIPDIAAWPPRDRAALQELLLAKGAPTERDFVHRLARHARLTCALSALSD